MVTFSDGARYSRIASRAASMECARISAIAAPTERSSGGQRRPGQARHVARRRDRRRAEIVARDHRPVPRPAQLQAHRLGAPAPRSPPRGSRRATKPAGVRYSLGVRPGSAARYRRPGRRDSSRSAPSRDRRCARRSPPGCPGSSPPITGPSARSIRASIQIEGAVSPRCGSVASSGAPPAVRRPMAAKALEAPASPGRGSGSNGLPRRLDDGPGRGHAVAPGKSSENCGSPITGAFGESGRMSRSRSGGSASDSRARSVSIAALSVICSAISFCTAIEFGRGPGRDVRREQEELRRAASQRLALHHPEPGVHPVGIGLERRPRRLGLLGHRLARVPVEVERAHQLVDRERLRPEDLAQPPLHGAAHQRHLPEPVLGMHEAEPEEGVAVGRSPGCAAPHSGRARSRSPGSGPSTVSVAS